MYIQKQSFISEQVYRYPLSPPPNASKADIVPAGYPNFNKICNFSISPTEIFFAERENQYLGAQLQYVFFLYTRFHLIPSKNIGDLARNS